MYSLDGGTDSSASGQKLSADLHQDSAIAARAS